jgi:integrase
MGGPEMEEAKAVEMSDTTSDTARKKKARAAQTVSKRWVVRKVYKRVGSPFWYGAVRDKDSGAVKYHATGETNQRRATQSLLEFAEELERQATKPKDEVRDPGKTFSACFEEWLGALDRPRPVTLRSYWQDYRGFTPEDGEMTKWGKPRKAVGVYKPFFGAMLLSEIQPADVDRFLKELRDGDASHRTKAKHINCLQAFFKWAKDRRYLHEIPVVADHKRFGKGTKKKNIALDHDQARALLVACQEKEILTVRDGVRCGGETWKQEVKARPYLYLAVLIGLHTGLRRKNILGLEWRHVDLVAGKISIPGEEMKGHQDHEMPIHPELAEVLRGLLPGRRKVPAKDPVLGDRLDSIETSFLSAQQRAKLPKIGWHTLRHTFATWVGLRVPFPVVKDLMAHKAKDVSEQYFHAPWDEKVEAIGKLPRLLNTQGSKEVARG